MEIAGYQGFEVSISPQSAESHFAEGGQARKSGTGVARSLAASDWPVARLPRQTRLLT